MVVSKLTCSFDFSFREIWRQNFVLWHGSFAWLSLSSYLPERTQLDVYLMTFYIQFNLNFKRQHNFSNRAIKKSWIFMRQHYCRNLKEVSQCYHLGWHHIEPKELIPINAQPPVKKAKLVIFPCQRHQQPWVFIGNWVLACTNKIFSITMTQSHPWCNISYLVVVTYNSYSFK